MTYFRLVSDLHLNREQRFSPVMLDEDWQTTLLVAGDIGNKKRAIEWLNEMSERFERVIVVLGNHDYYNHDAYDNYDQEAGIEADTYLEKLQGWRDSIAKLNDVYLLENETLNIGKVRIIGATLWTDFKADPFIMRTAQLNMADYRLIFQNREKEPVSPTHTNRWHNDSLALIKQAVVQSRKDEMTPFIVTHHAPTWQCVTSQDHLEDELTHAYCTNLDDVIVETKAAVWAYGHTHEAFAKTIGETLVISNPHGFQSEFTGFVIDQQLIIDDSGAVTVKTAYE